MSCCEKLREARNLFRFNVLPVLLQQAKSVMGLLVAGPRVSTPKQVPKKIPRRTIRDVWDIVWDGKSQYAVIRFCYKRLRQKKQQDSFAKVLRPKMKSHM